MPLAIYSFSAIKIMSLAIYSFSAIKIMPLAIYSFSAIKIMQLAICSFPGIKIMPLAMCLFLGITHISEKSLLLYEPRCEKTGFFAYAKTKTPISFAVSAKLISALVFATRIVQSIYLLNPKFQCSSHLLWLYSPVCVGPGRKPRRPVFSQRGSYVFRTLKNRCEIRGFQHLTPKVKTYTDK